MLITLDGKQFVKKNNACLCTIVSTVLVPIFERGYPIGFFVPCDRVPVYTGMPSVNSCLYVSQWGAIHTKKCLSVYDCLCCAGTHI